MSLADLSFSELRRPRAEAAARFPPSNNSYSHASMLADLSEHPVIALNWDVGDEDDHESGGALSEEPLSRQTSLETLEGGGGEGGSNLANLLAGGQGSESSGGVAATGGELREREVAYARCTPRRGLIRRVIHAD